LQVVFKNEEGSLMAAQRYAKSVNVRLARLAFRIGKESGLLGG